MLQFGLVLDLRLWLGAVEDEGEGNGLGVSGGLGFRLGVGLCLGRRCGYGYS